MARTGPALTASTLRHVVTCRRRPITRCSDAWRHTSSKRLRVHAAAATMTQHALTVVRPPTLWNTGCSALLVARIDIFGRPDVTLDILCIPGGHDAGRAMHSVLESALVCASSSVLSSNSSSSSNHDCVQGPCNGPCHP